MGVIIVIIALIGFFLYLFASGKSRLDHMEKAIFIEELRLKKDLE